LSGSFNVRNRHLSKLLKEKGCDNEETWRSITVNEGSVQKLDCLNHNEKDVFKTAFELDQRWIIEFAADRTACIDQAQSVNVFLPADVHKRDLHQIHFTAWKLGMKSLYYCRSKSIQRAEDVSTNEAGFDNKKFQQDQDLKQNSTDYEECLACQ